MNLLSWILLGAVILWLTLAVAHILRNRGGCGCGSGKSCCGDCAACGKCCGRKETGAKFVEK